MIIRHATVDDAAAVAAVMNDVIGEGQFTLFDRPFSVEDERSFLASLGARSAVFVAQDDSSIVGVQSLDLYSSLATSMSHVATMGTWLTQPARGRGIGRRLAAESFRFAELCGYRKIVIQVLGGNERALRFYSSLGFTRVGIAREQVSLNALCVHARAAGRPRSRPEQCEPCRRILASQSDAINGDVTNDGRSAERSIYRLSAPYQAAG